MSGPFAKTTFGPPAPGTTDTNKGALIADIQSAIPEMVDMAGNTHGIESTQLLLQAQTALTTITTAQTLFSNAFLASTLNKKNRTLQVTIFAVFTTAGGQTPTIAIALKLGSVTLCTLTSAAVAASTTNGQLQAQFVVSVVATGASGTLESHGNLMAQLSTTLTTALATYADGNTAVSSAVDLTAAETLTATVTASGGTIGSLTVRQAIIEVLN